MPAPANLFLAGLGGVGQGLLELWSERADPRFRIVAACDTQGAVHQSKGLEPASLLNAKRGAGLRAVRNATYAEGQTPLECFEKAAPDILVNLLPCRYESPPPPLPLVRAALESGTHVVTAEKASMVLGFEALRRSAEAGRALLRYSACVGGSVPFIPTLEWVARAHQIRRVTGVLNATTTYILSELEARRHTPDEILEKARTLGILERDPSLDLQGHDLAAKAVLVHNTVYDTPIAWHRADRRGITEFLEDPHKLRVGTRLVATVEPGRVTLEAPNLPMHSPLRVYGMENAILVDTPHAGELYVRGVGAGGRGTATNVYGDLVRVAQAPRRGDVAVTTPTTRRS